MKITTIAAIAASFVLLNACATNPPISQQLAGKSDTERQKILEHSCHDEAARNGGTNRSSQFYNHVKKMQEICDQFSHELKK